MMSVVFIDFQLFYFITRIFPVVNATTELKRGVYEYIY